MADSLHVSMIVPSVIFPVAEFENRKPLFCKAKHEPLIAHQDGLQSIPTAAPHSTEVKRFFCRT